jgi:tetratricopeptide (TPR) repeat protein
MTDVNQLYNQAEQLKDQGQLTEAIDRLEELLRVEPRHVLSHLALAVLYGKVGDHQRAVEHGHRACEIDPSDAFNFTAMSVTYQRAWQGTQQGEYIQFAEVAMARARELEQAAALKAAQQRPST